MTLEEKLKVAADLLLTEAAQQVNIPLTEDLLDRAIKQDGLVLDMMLGLGKTKAGEVYVTLRMCESETGLEVEDQGATFDECLDGIIEQVRRFIPEDR